MTLKENEKNTLYSQTTHNIESRKEDIGLQVDQAALVWFRKQHKITFPDRSVFFHPLAFIKFMLMQLCDEYKPKIKHLVTESERKRKLPSQHIHDAEFSRSLKYLSKNHRIASKPSIAVEAGDIVIFSEEGSYRRFHWSLCGSAGRLYHINRDCDHVTGSYLSDQKDIICVLEVLEFNRLTL